MRTAHPQLLPRPDPNLVHTQQDLPLRGALASFSCTLSPLTCWTLLRHRGPSNTSPRVGGLEKRAKTHSKARDHFVCRLVQGSANLFLGVQLPSSSPPAVGAPGISFLPPHGSFPPCGGSSPGRTAVM